MEFTASNIATLAIASVRVLSGGVAALPWFANACSIVEFQSVTTSPQAIEPPIASELPKIELIINFIIIITIKLNTVQVFAKNN